MISALDGGEWSASRPGRFIPRESAVKNLSINQLWCATQDVNRKNTNSKKKLAIIQFKKLLSSGVL
jgi:hypothetical protein